MQESIKFFPDTAAAGAAEVDLLYYFLILVSVVMTVLIFGAVAIFAVKYRRRSEDEIPKPIEGSTKLEITWSVIPFLIMLVMFGWAAAAPRAPWRRRVRSCSNNWGAARATCWMNRAAARSCAASMDRRFCSTTARPW